MNKQYRRERNHNYLILSYEEDTKNYLYHMFLENQFDNIIPCTEEMINSKIYLYYDISSLQCISNIYGIKEITEDQINQLMISLKNVVKTMGMCLLDGEGLLLSPENIYQDISTDKWYFIYFPGKRVQQERGKELQELADFLIMKTEHTNQTAIEMSYQLYQKIQEGGDIQSCIQFLTIQDSQEKIPIGILDSDSECVCEDSDRKADIRQQKVNVNICPEIEKTIVDQQKRSKTGIFMLKRSALLIGVIIAISLGVTRCFVLTLFEQLILFGVGITISIVFTIFCLVYNQKKADKRKKPWENECDNPDLTYENDVQESDISIENIDEKTVYMGEEITNRKHKLYGIGRQKSIKIELNDFPFLIGKRGDMVDFALNDETISKIHARFRKDNNEIFLSDTNSLNGVFKNGVRLDPNEEVLVEEEDEIQFGTMTFIYR